MRGVGLLLLRLAAGTILIGHGYTKLFGGKSKHAPELMETLYGPNFHTAVEQGGPESMARQLETMEVPASTIAAYLSGAAEFGGGLAFLIGWRTRQAAPIVLFNMITAIRKVH